jgi:hypothetical protein
MAQFKEATLTTGEKIIVNVDEIRLMHWIQDATTIRFAKDHGVQIKETPEHLMMSSTLRNTPRRPARRNSGSLAPRRNGCPSRHRRPLLHRQWREGHCAGFPRQQVITLTPTNPRCKTQQ